MAPYTVEQLERMPVEELDGLLAVKLFDASALDRMAGHDWDASYREWAYWNDVDPRQWACQPDSWGLKPPRLSSSYEGMARVIQKMVEQGFNLNITCESEVVFIDLDGKETRYAGDGEGGKCLPLFIAIAAILALEGADKQSLAKWSVRGRPNGSALHVMLG